MSVKRDVERVPTYSFFQHGKTCYTLHLVNPHFYNIEPDDVFVDPKGNHYRMLGYSFGNKMIIAERIMSPRDMLKNAYRNVRLHYNRKDDNRMPLGDYNPVQVPDGYEDVARKCMWDDELLEFTGWINYVRKHFYTRIKSGRKKFHPKYLKIECVADAEKDLNTPFDTDFRG